MGNNNTKNQSHAWKELVRRDRNAINNPPSIKVWRDKNSKVVEECIALSQARLTNWREEVRSAKTNKGV